MAVKNIKQNIDFKIKTHDVLLFDMDGTLVETDFANFLSYKKAIQSVINSKKEIQYISGKRFNRSALESMLPDLTKTEFEKIIQLEEENYKEHLVYTKLNKVVVEVLLQYSKTNKTILVTNCREDRALITLDYYNLSDKFNKLFFRKISGNKKRINKYKNVVSSLDLSTQAVMIFENEKQEVEDAILAGISINNIFRV